MGCDSPLPDGKEHEFTVSGDTIRMKTCPRKGIQEVADYFRVHLWAEKGRLGYIYREDELPAHVAQAMDIIDAEHNDKLRSSLEKYD